MQVERHYRLDRGILLIRLSAASVHELFDSLLLHGLSITTASSLADHAWRTGHGFSGLVSLHEELPEREHFDAQFHSFWEGLP